MRVLVTGVSGFSGCAVARRLASAGHDVVGTHRRDTDFLSSLRDVRRLELIRTDLADAGQLAGPFDAIVHTAATSPAPGVDVATLVRDNIGASFALIEAARRWRTSRFVFFSSLSYYGRIAQDVVDEATPVRDPDAYGATKLIVEQRLAELPAEFSTLALRLPGIVGPGAHRNWLSGVASRLRAGKPIRAFHLDRPYNNAAHIDDIAALIQTLLSREPSGGFGAAVLGAAGSLTVREIIDRLALALGVSAKIEEIAPTNTSFTLSSAHAIARYDYQPSEIGAMIDRYGREIKG
ncbi:NAD(P)-dependent oxidoreductase [Bradyrhizobium sp. INPA01-394B]|uniref:NAD(P)-dependent oxidoreductase n=1 Tax=Bradyrhizobium campsiandrae TaxID=1729892 RepID=A0ABR7U493_9BRAD|nr:NAD(P)-dependent oxidoreductase [Bradyrhizobium campsiandrae]MBC9879803.1 NAD(P)-dependent oxidoreductase [Bradyrhizobium campsiandrae]MBC9978864.1 NAD(P)-dependent oxidoreductase [Bradyrhizobium campsiandrae]